MHWLTNQIAHTKVLVAEPNRISSNCYEATRKTSQLTSTRHKSDNAIHGGAQKGYKAEIRTRNKSVSNLSGNINPRSSKVTHCLTCEPIRFRMREWKKVRKVLNERRKERFWRKESLPNEPVPVTVYMILIQANLNYAKRRISSLSSSTVRNIHKIICRLCSQHLLLKKDFSFFYYY